MVRIKNVMVELFDGVRIAHFDFHVTFFCERVGGMIQCNSVYFYVCVFVVRSAWVDITYLNRFGLSVSSVPLRFLPPTQKQKI